MSIPVIRSHDLGTRETSETASSDSYLRNNINKTSTFPLMSIFYTFETRSSIIQLLQEDLQHLQTHFGMKVFKNQD